MIKIILFATALTVSSVAAAASFNINTCMDNYAKANPNGHISSHKLREVCHYPYHPGPHCREYAHAWGFHGIQNIRVCHPHIFHRIVSSWLNDGYGMCMQHYLGTGDSVNGAFIKCIGWKP